jgi:hypothetical protein
MTSQSRKDVENLTRKEGKCKFCGERYTGKNWLKNLQEHLFTCNGENDLNCEDTDSDFDESPCVNVPLQ